MKKKSEAQSWLDLYRAARVATAAAPSIQCRKVNKSGLPVECFFRDAHGGTCAWTMSRLQLERVAAAPPRFQSTEREPLEVVSLRLAKRHVEELDRRARDHGANRSAAVRAWLDEGRKA